jgi:hypothetical protein
MQQAGRFPPVTFFRRTPVPAFFLPHPRFLSSAASMISPLEKKISEERRILAEGVVLRGVKGSQPMHSRRLESKSK